MGFLDKFKSKEKESKQNEHVAAYKKMIELLDVGADAVEKLKRCVDDPRAYYDENAESYDERGVGTDADDDTIIWLGMVDILIEQGRMFEFDYSVELEDFIYGIRQINRDSLVVEEDALDEDADITQWLKILNTAWMELGVVMAGMDIDSDSYCVCMITRDVFEKIVVLAEKTGHRIALAQEL